MTTCGVDVQTQTPGGATAPLTNAWLYWREAGTITLRRTDGSGRVRALVAGGEATRPEAYIGTFAPEVGTTVELFFSRGAKPIPEARLEPAVFFPAVTLALSPPPPLPPPGAPPAPLPAGTPVRPVAVSPAMSRLVNTLVCVPIAVVTLPDITVQLDVPAELSLWPVLFDLLEEPSVVSPLAVDFYYLQGLPQGAAWWAQTGQREDDVAPAPSTAARPRERGVRVAGSIDARATGAVVRMADASGGLLPLRGASGAASTEVAARLAPLKGATRGFEAHVFFEQPATAFGPVHVLVTSTGGVSPPILGGFACHLVGVQVALADDRDPAAAPSDTDGQQRRGVVPGEAEEVIVVDFTRSPLELPPQTPAAERSRVGAALMAPKTRVRRMVSYDITADRAAPVSITTSKGSQVMQLLQPNMPLWMAELQLVGLDRAGLEELLQRRKQRLAGKPTSLRFELRWELALVWGGPDRAGADGYRCTQAYLDSASVTVELDAKGVLANVTAQGEMPLTPPPPVLNVPVAKRRLPVLAFGLTRAWGRGRGAVARPTVVIEWQPRMVMPTTASGTLVEEELIRGGDGVLTLGYLTIDGARIDPGLTLRSGKPKPPPAGPDARLPRFRVRGRNPGPDGQQVDALINALVEDFYETHADPWIRSLELKTWQVTARLAVGHESDRCQFIENHETAGRFTHGLRVFGKERHMPTFGGPHGYGLGQIDHTPTDHEIVWHFVKNLKEAIRILMEVKVLRRYACSEDPVVTTPGHRPTNERRRYSSERLYVDTMAGGSSFGMTYSTIGSSCHQEQTKFNTQTMCLHQRTG